MYYEDENQYMPDEDFDNQDFDHSMLLEDMHMFYLDQERLKAAGPGYYNVPKITYPTDDLPF